MDVKPNQVKPDGELVAELSISDEKAQSRGAALAFDEPAVGPPAPEQKMPDFIWPQFGFYHTIDSALASLSRAGITPERITIKKIGRGWQSQRVVEQHPDDDSP